MLNLQKYKSIAQDCMPKVHIINHQYLNRFEIAGNLNGYNNIGIELGVATGVYSSMMLQSSRFQMYFGIDEYGDMHDTQEYINTLKLVGFDNPVYKLIRCNFDSALSLFPDSYFDFIYIDGYAHTGEEGGKTLVDWWPKLKQDGIFAGEITI